MKSHLLLLIAVPIFVCSSCRNETKYETPNGFSNELTTLCNRTFNLFCTTRSGLETLNTEALNDMIAYATAVSEKYDLKAIVQASGHYSNIDETLAEMDFYEILKYFEDNSTPEFYAMIQGMIVDEKAIDNSSIINNSGLLPNEQMALIMVNNIMNSDLINLQTRASGCKETYDASMKTCKKWLYGTLAGSVACAVFSFGTLSAVCAAAAAVDYDRCSGAAMDTYMNCIER